MNFLVEGMAIIRMNLSRESGLGVRAISPRICLNSSRSTLAMLPSRRSARKPDSIIACIRSADVFSKTDNNFFPCLRVALMQVLLGGRQMTARFLIYRVIAVFGKLFAKLAKNRNDL